MSVGTYLGVSLLSVAIYVPVIFTLAYSFGDEIEAALNVLKRLGNVAWGLFFLVVSLWLVMRSLMSRPSSAKRRRTEP
jgi:membrane protein DedA with SNARE-associated domain